MSTHKLPELIKRFETILAKAQLERKSRRSLVDVAKVYIDGLDKIPEWNLYELRVMQDAVNQIRKDSALSLFSLEDIRRAEAGAVGHSDYSHKFSLYCAELALNLI